MTAQRTPLCKTHSGAKKFPQLSDVIARCHYNKIRHVVAQFIGRAPPDKSGNYNIDMSLRGPPKEGRGNFTVPLRANEYAEIASSSFLKKDSSQ